MGRAWRITKAKHAANAFQGEGARMFGSRWSSPGTRVAFASETLSLAVLEVLVHLQKSPGLAGYVVFTVDFPNRCIEQLDESLLPENWRHFPAPPQVQAIGDRWIDTASSVILRVPSAIIPQEYNFLINPAHNEFAELVIGGPTPLEVDSRVFGDKAKISS